LTLTTGVMVIGRAFAKPVVHRFSPQGVLLLSAVIASLGLFLLSTLTGNAVFFAALVFGIGVCYFWPTMIGFVAENIPKSGALGLNLIGGAGMFAVSIYSIFMGKHYDQLIANYLPNNVSVSEYLAAPANSAMGSAVQQAKSQAGPEILQLTLIIPILLIFLFTGLLIYMRRRRNSEITPVLQTS
jgi:fucose permease